MKNFSLVGPEKFQEIITTATGKNGAMEPKQVLSEEGRRLYSEAKNLGIGLNSQNATFSHDGRLSLRGSSLHDGLLRAGWSFYSK